MHIETALINRNSLKAKHTKHSGSRLIDIDSAVEYLSEYFTAVRTQV